MDKNHVNVRKVVGIGIFAAIVVVLQFISMNLRFTMFSITLTLVPIVVGAAVYGLEAGAILGAVFGLTVLLTGDANPFIAISPLGTVLVVMVKGIAAGFLAGLVYRLTAKKSDIVGAIAAAVTAPVVNTGIFTVGCFIFFLDTLTEWGSAAGFDNVGAYIILSLAGINFLIELAINLVLSPVIVRLIHIGKKE